MLDNTPPAPLKRGVRTANFQNFSIKNGSSYQSKISILAHLSSPLERG
jgi:hypothetical protein